MERGYGQRSKKESTLSLANVRKSHPKSETSKQGKFEISSGSSMFFCSFLLVAMHLLLVANLVTSSKARSPERSVLAPFVAFPLFLLLFPCFVGLLRPLDLSFRWGSRSTWTTRGPALAKSRGRTRRKTCSLALVHQKEPCRINCHTHMLPSQRISFLKGLFKSVQF